MLAGAGALLAGAGLAAARTRRRPSRPQEGGAGDGIMGDPTAGGPVDAAGIPLARRDYPVTLPKIGDPIKAGDPERGGELQVYNYADYLNPEVIKAFGEQEGVSVRVTTFQSLDEAFTKLSTGRFQFDVIFTAPDHLPRLVGRRLVQPLNFDLIPNLREGGLAGAAQPVLRRRAALLGAVHALHDRDRLAQRQARRLRSRTSSAGSRSGSPSASAGASACSTTRARGSGWR